MIDGFPQAQGVLVRHTVSPDGHFVAGFILLFWGVQWNEAAKRIKQVFKIM